MPSVTDIQEQQQQQTSTIQTKGVSATSTDSNNADSMSQAILILEKKQRNLGKRKEKLESYQEDEKSGKVLNKDQKEALSKYAEVLSQIECFKELIDQFKKIQTESIRNQKRLSKQVAEEKRSSISQNLRQYAQMRYLLDHRPTTLKPEESSLLDDLSSVIIPPDESPNSISCSVDTFLSIYQNGPTTTIKNLTGKNSQEVRDILEQIINNSNIEKSVTTTTTPTTTATTTIAEVEPLPEQQPIIEEHNERNNDQLTNRNRNVYPTQFDTRSQHIPLEQIVQDSTFLSDDVNHQIQENQDDQSSHSNEYLTTFTVVNSNLNNPQTSQIQNPTDTTPSNAEQWQQPKGNVHSQQSGQFNNEAPNRNYNNRSGYYQQTKWGPRDYRYDNSYSSGGGQRQYYDNRGRGGSNPHYRGNRGGAYRGGQRGYYNNGNGYQQSAQYQQNTDQQRQIRSAPSQQQQQQQQQQQ